MSDLLEQVVQPYDNRITFIYGLIDPRTEYVRYVGKADNPRGRLAGHLLPSQLKYRTHKAHWLRGLVELGKKPQIIILQKVQYADWQDAERKWIAYFRSIPGYPKLTNTCDGGEGIAGYVMPEEIRKKIAAARIGIPMPPGTGKKISDANRGRRKTAEHRTHLGEGQRNRWQNASEDERAAMLKNLRNPPSTERRIQGSKRARNAKRIDNASSKYRNVIKVTENGKTHWRVGCIINGKQRYIGVFDTEDEAAHARDCYVLKHIGENVILNFPRSEYAQNPKDIVINKPRRHNEKMKTNTSGYKGIHKNGKNGWSASINYMGVKYHLGTHRTMEVAAKAYDRKAIEFYGDHAKTNFPIADYE